MRSSSGMDHVSGAHQRPEPNATRRILIAHAAKANICKVRQKPALKFVQFCPISEEKRGLALLEQIWNQLNYVSHPHQGARCARA